MDNAYPLRCQPHFQNYLWGGRKLATRLGKQLPAEGVWAESWEIIDHPHHQSLVTNGSKAGQTLRQIIQQSPIWLLGPRLQGSGVRSLPLLLKYLDCQQVLSIQVHPSDRYALMMTPPDLGKTEAWYVLDAEPGAVLYAGLHSRVSASELRSAIVSNKLLDCLHAIYPKTGDCIFIPSGTVHALGAGLVVAEIQQASNTTFRLYDWNRVGPDGNPRPLHIDQALEVTDFNSGPRPLQIPCATSETGRDRLVACDKFTLDRLSHVQQSDYGRDSSKGSSIFSIGGDETFHILTAPQGGVELIGQDFQETLAQGQSVLIPAALRDCTARVGPGSFLLDMYIAE